jgi:hypothetical protein
MLMKKRSWPSLSNCAGAEKAESNEMIVLDANILIRAILGRRVRQLIDTYASLGVRFLHLTLPSMTPGGIYPSS